MGKPGGDVYERFVEAYEAENERAGKSSSSSLTSCRRIPAPRSKEAVELAEYCGIWAICPSRCRISPDALHRLDVHVLHGLDPRTMKPVYVPGPRTRRRFSALIQYRNPANYDLVHEALVRAGRRDLIGYGDACLIRPRRQAGCRTRAARASESGRGKATPSERASEGSKAKRSAGGVGRKQPSDRSEESLAANLGRRPREVVGRCSSAGRGADRTGRKGVRDEDPHHQRAETRQHGKRGSTSPRLRTRLHGRGMTSASSPAWPPTTRARSSARPTPGSCVSTATSFPSPRVRHVRRDALPFVALSRDDLGSASSVRDGVSARVRPGRRGIQARCGFVPPSLPDDVDRARADRASLFAVCHSTDIRQMRSMVWSASVSCPPFGRSPGSSRFTTSRRGRSSIATASTPIA